MNEKKIDLNKEVFNKTQYVKTIDTNFNELGVNSLTVDIQQTPTVDEFFDLYNQLFYDIPEFGDTNSHQFLIQTSADYINFSPQNDEINALREEITQLRQDLLDTQVQLVESQTGGVIDKSQIEDLKQQIQSPSSQEILNNINSELSDS